MYKYFLNRTLKSLTIKIDKMDFIRIELLTIERMKMQATNSKKLFSICIFDKGLVQINKKDKPI